MIKPTIGRVVWFRPFDLLEHEQPHAALITYVWSDTRINIAAFYPNGGSYNETSVYLRQEDAEVPEGSYAEWMPYQVGQAKKHEEVK